MAVDPDLALLASLAGGSDLARAFGRIRGAKTRPLAVQLVQQLAGEDHDAATSEPEA